MARPRAAASSSTRLAAALLLVLAGCLGTGFVGSLPGGRGMTRSHFFSPEEEVEGAAAAVEEVQKEAREVEPPEDDERAAAHDGPSGFGVILGGDPWAFVNVNDDSDVKELAKSLARTLGRSSSKFASLCLRSPAVRWKLLRTLKLVGNPQNPLWAQVLPRLRDRKMRLRVTRNLPLALPEEDEEVSLKAAGTTDPQAFARAMMMTFFRMRDENRQALMKVTAFGPEAENMVLMALERLQQMVWLEISFAAKLPDVIWVHVHSAEPSGAPLWKLFPSVDDAGNETAEALAERVAALLKVHSLQHVDLVSRGSCHRMFETLAALPPELHAAGLIAQRVADHAGTATRTRIIKDFPEQTEPTTTFFVSGETNSSNLAGALKGRVLEDQLAVGRSLQVQLKAVGPRAANTAFLAVEALKWRLNREFAFTATHDGTGGFVVNLTFL